MKKTQSTQKKTTKKDKEFRLDKKYVKELGKMGVEVRYSPACPGAFLYYEQYQLVQLLIGLLAKIKLVGM